MNTVRPAAQAGLFYPADQARLQEQVQSLLAAIPARPAPVPKVLIVPHAGYVYSGPVAAAAYATIRDAASRITRVVLLGPCHRVGVRGLALPTAQYFATPLGPVEIDTAGCEALLQLPQVNYFDPTHEQEHSLEVQLPFLLEVLDKFQLIPLVVGQASAQQVAHVLDMVWGGPETLVVISSDLSHFLPYEQAQASDLGTCHAIEQLQVDTIGSAQACGAFALNGLLAVARQRQLQVETLALLNSGDTAGTKDKVVGYGAWALFEPAAPVVASPHEHDASAASSTPSTSASSAELDWRPYRLELLSIAARALRIGVDKGSVEGVAIHGLPAALNAPGAVFVTLTKAGRLRGCIGSLTATRSLALDVLGHAFNAAYKDHRFKPVSPDEFAQLEISISVLLAPQAMQISSETDLLQQLRPGIDGLIIASGGHRAVYLPSVWEQLPRAEEFLHQLKLKAGMSASYWADDFSAQRFTTEKFSSLELPDPGVIWQ